MSYEIVISTCPNHTEAERIARHLVEAELAACVNIVPAVRSIYRWQGRVESNEEVLMIIKILARRYSSVERAIRERHSYDVPEIIALPISRGFRRYLDWIGVRDDHDGS